MLAETKLGVDSPRVINTDLLNQSANEARGLAIDAVHACSSGHLGLPLGCAEIGSILFGDASNGLNYNPDAPKWLNRDRFILSAGHGSMFLYSWLHLSGYEVSLQDVSDFRKLGSITPGHPEFDETPGVEATTGPLGQGVGNAVGYALSGKQAAAKFNTAEHAIFNHHVVALLGDGCLQEGVSKEAIAFAGHNQLDNLILIYDSNDVTLDAMADVTQGENAEQYFTSQGWDAVTIDGHDLVAVSEALRAAKTNDNGKPKVIIAKTEIGRGIPEVAGTAKGHGEGGANFAESARRGMGLPDETFYVSEQTKSYFAERKETGKAAFQAWNEVYEAWKAANPELAEELAANISKSIPSDLIDQIPEFSSDYSNATRAAGGDVIQAVAKALPSLVTGSADLYGSTKNYIKEAGDFGPQNYAGRNIWYGIREHAMGAISNGIAYDGLFRASCATFAVFADYLRPSIRLAALAKLPVTYILTHDSVGVGEDGPTHQPVEQLSALRSTPNLHTWRPCDTVESAVSWKSAIERRDGPAALVFSRQGLAPMPRDAEQVAAIARGGYILKDCDAPQAILIATGSEVELAVNAADELASKGIGVRVVSMPCAEIFSAQDAAYRDSVLTPAIRARVAVEALHADYWYKFVGLDGRVVGMRSFGESAPGGELMKEFGFTVDNVVSNVMEAIG